jgi:Fic family protein
LVNIWDIIEPNKWWIRKLPGTVIANSFWETIYTPPVWEVNIRNYLKNLEDFINNFDDDIDPLIKAWVIHYQFESIHPFYDWNWRTGRVLMVLYIVLAWKLDYPILFLSEYINKNKTDYYKILNNTSKTWDYKEIIIFILKAIEKQSEITAKKIIAINNLINELNNKINDEKIVKFIFSNPFISIKFMSENMWITRQTASKYIKKLEWLHLLDSIDYSKTKLYFNPEFVKILS